MLLFSVLGVYYRYTYNIYVAIYVYHANFRFTISSWNGKTFNCTCTLDSTELCLCFSTLAELQIKPNKLQWHTDRHMNH